VTDLPAVLVTDGDRRIALAAVRSLGRAGYPVVVAAVHRDAMAAASRFARSLVLAPEPLASPAPFREAILSTIREHDIGVVLPVSDASNLALLGNRAEFGRAVVAGPSHAAFVRISDKASLAVVAQEVGIRVPRQVVLTRPADLATLEPTLSFPVVVKPVRSVQGGKSWAVGYADSVDDLRAMLGPLDNGTFPLLLQQKIVGGGSGVYLLRWDGRIRAAFQHRRVREYPPSGGGSSCCESVPLDEELLALSTRLLERHDWQGVAMVEYKVEHATGTPYLMEVNGRLWGSLQLAIDAGVDFPRLLVEAACGRPPGPAPTYRTGVRLRLWWRDVDHLLSRLRHSDAALRLPPGSKSRAGAVLEFLRWRRTERLDTLRWDDPRPFFTESRQWLSDRLRTR
jgi:predicted ATP-grasp superfamily ATP-dependent carboligase